MVLSPGVPSVARTVDQGLYGELLGGLADRLPLRDRRVETQDALQRIRVTDRTGRGSLSQPAQARTEVRPDVAHLLEVSHQVVHARLEPVPFLPDRHQRADRGAELLGRRLFRRQ